MREREGEERGGRRRGIERESENHKGGGEGGKYTNGLTAIDSPPPAPHLCFRAHEKAE